MQVRERRFELANQWTRSIEPCKTNKATCADEAIIQIVIDGVAALDPDK